ncbi:MaoC family dehydratase [Chloroflexota bacterium]
MVEKSESILDKLGVGIGFKTTHTKTITEADINLFAEVCGDFNPVHMQEEYAKKTFFSGRIAHGALTLSLLSAAMSKLPGLVIFLGATDKFLAPVRIGDTITATGEVIGVREDKGIVTLKASCTNQKGETLVEGEWTVRLYEAPV